MANFIRLQSAAVGRIRRGFVARGELSDHIYGMVIKLKTDDRLTITGLEGEMVRYTTDRCSLGLEFLAEAEGLKVDEEGFEAQVKKVVGRPGCRHLATLLITLARALVRARARIEGQTSGG